MKPRLTIVCALSIFLSACSASQTPPVSTPSSSPAATIRSGTLRLGVGSSDNVSDVPRLVAVETLRSMGYTINQVQFDRFELLSVALANGDLDLAGASHQTTWTAIAKGAPVRALVARDRDTYVLVVRQEIKNCSDLTGKNLAIASTSGVTTALVNAYLKKNCPSATPKVLIISGTGNRVAALLANQIDASPLELDDLLNLERQAPGRFYALATFAVEMPQIELSGYYTNLGFAAQRPEAVKDFLRAFLQAQRQLQDKNTLRRAITKYLGLDDSTAQTTAEMYLAQKMWDVNGGLTPESTQATIDFLVAASALPPGLKSRDVADLSFLNAVLDEIGRK